MSKGYVYVLSNKALPGLMKIGYSLDSGEKRRTRLSNTGLPHPFVLAFEISSFAPELLERSIHDRLVGFRENRRREFFRLDETSAIMAVIDCWLYAAGFGSNYFNEWREHITNFSPAEPVPDQTPEYKSKKRERAEETLKGLRALFSSASEGGV